MSDDPNKFWKQLQEKAADPEGFVPLTDAEAERRMAEAGEEPMSEEEIARIVDSATAEGPRGVVTEGPRVHTRHLRHWTKAAAVVLGAVLFAAAGVWVWRGVYIEDLPYREAFDFALDQGEVDAKRRTAIAHVMVKAIEGIRTIKALRTEEGPLHAVSERVLGELRGTLEGGEVFTPARDWPRVRKIRTPIQQLRVFVSDPKQDAAARLAKVRDLAEQISLGILMSKRVRTEGKASPTAKAPTTAARALVVFGRVLARD